MTAYKPFIFKLNKPNIDKIYSDNSVIHSSNINQPLISLGFHSFIHRTREAMSITQKLETKNEFYYVVNPFENRINDYDKDIDHITDVFLNKPNIVSRHFYKIWEILYMFDIASMDKMSMAGLGDETGAIIQAFVEFREQYFDPSKDTVYGMTRDDMIDMKMVNAMNERYDKMIEIIKTNIKPKKTTKKLTTDGDMTNIKTVEYLRDHIKEGTDLVIADGSKEWHNKNYIEQEAYGLILGEILSAINILNKDGSFVLKVYDTFTHITIKIIYLLTSFFDTVYIYKPFTSRNTNNEKYIVCKGFNYNHKDPSIVKKIKPLEEALIKCRSDHYINDMFPKFILDDKEIEPFKYINIMLVNVQQIYINKVITYIKSNNYFGDMYHSYRDQQINANKWWIDNYLSDKLNDKTALIKETCSYNESEMGLFLKKLI